MKEHKDTSELVELALNAACKAVQDELGETDGGLAGVMFSGELGDNFRKIFSEYCEAELRAAQRRKEFSDFLTDAFK
jgi:hypothetical protein